MAPIQLEPKIRYNLVAVAGCQLTLALGLSVLVGRSLWRSYRGLGPAQDTRERRAARSRLIPVFASLALVSLLSAAYTTADYAILSYKVWASQRDLAIPTKFYGHGGVVPFGANATDVLVTRWLSDTPIHLEAVEILAEKSRRFWWGQQLDLALVSWSMLLAIEGRRRNMPLLWSYQLLGQLVSLSFAQNLFFIALLLTPTPLPVEDRGSLPVSRYIRMRNAIFAPKPQNWTPSPLLYSLVFVANFAAIGLYSILVNTPSLSTAILTVRALTLAPLVLPYIVPQGLGTVHTHPHEAYSQYSSLFKFISLASLVLHGKATLLGLAHAAPDAYYHRHSIYLPFDTERRSAWERTTSGFGRILGAMADHPVVTRVGWDVLLSALSIGMWSAARSQDAAAILACSVPLMSLPEHGDLEVNGEASKAKSPKRIKARASTGSSGGDEHESGSARRRSRPRKSTSGDDDGDDATYEPTASELAGIVEGDALPGAGEIGWESTALVWGLTTLGGLGVGSAGVFGAECVAR